MVLLSMFKMQVVVVVIQFQIFVKAIAVWGSEVVLNETGFSVQTNVFLG